MEELEQILREHAKRYPLMQPCDAVKLIYQNEFGGGHLIGDEQACLNYLRLEYADLEKDLEQLGKNFIDSAAKHKGTMDSFLNKLEVLRKLTAEGVFAFDTNALTSYLFEYKADGYPAVSHDEIYRTTYKPAYRIVLSEMCE